MPREPIGEVITVSITMDTFGWSITFGVVLLLAWLVWRGTIPDA